MMREEHPSILETLFERARQYHEDNRARKGSVQEELSELETQIAKKRQELDAINFRHRLFASFQGRIGDNYQCPRCLMFDGVFAWLSPVSSKTQLDFFSCNKCGTEFTGIPKEAA